MSKIELPIKNFAAQQTIFDTKSRYVIVPKGRRFGLTRGTANNYIRMALAREFTRGLWVDTVNANIERYVERYFIPALRKLPDKMWQWQKQQKILTILDAYIDFRSVDNPENIEGFDYDYAFLNEAGIILKNEYLFENAIQPMLWDEKCRIIVGGTPKGKGLFYNLYQRGLDPEQPNFQSFTFSTFDNPYVPVELIKEDMKSMPQRVIDQEIYAHFLEDTGVVFRGVTGVATLDPSNIERNKPIDGHIYVIGCDLAKVQDFTVLTVYDRRTNDQVCQMRFNQLEWSFQKEKIKMLSDRYNHALIMMDSTGVGEPIFDDLSRAGVPVEGVHFTNEIKKNLIEKLATWIEQKQCRMLNLEETINELNSFTYDYSEKTGRIMYNAPVGFHDDIVISHALAIWGLQPLLERKEEPEKSVIARDLYEKKKANEREQEGWDSFEYEEV